MQALDEPAGMGSYFQVVAFPEVPAAEAADLAQTLVATLVARGVVLAAPRGDELSPGYPPGPNAHEHTEPDFEHTRELSHNGLVVETKRSVFDAGEFGIELACHGCALEFEPDPTTFGDRVGEWFDGDDDASFSCPACGNRERLTDWDGPQPWVFGHLGLTFWNWPPLLPAFVRSLEDTIGHPARVVHGKL
ncbi:MAG: hypothetical protein SangKO_020270 [Sandaracinaceae bacterium]